LPKSTALLKESENSLLEVNCRQCNAFGFEEKRETNPKKDITDFVKK